VKPTDLSRIGVGLLVIATLVTGVVVGSATFASDPGATPTPTVAPSSAAATPTVAPLPEADVDGEDLARLPRYPGSVRTQHEVSVDDRFRLTLTEYLADATLDEVRAFYLGVIADHGWQRADVGYSGGEWTYVLVDGATEALVEIEVTRGLVEIDLQISEPISDPTPSPTPAPPATPAATPAPTPVPPPDDDDDDDDDGGGASGDSDDGDSDD
jgi:hypothetical protein